MSGRHSAATEALALGNRTRAKALVPRRTLRNVARAGVFTVATGLAVVMALPAYAMTPTGTNPVASTVNAGGTFVDDAGTAQAQTQTLDVNASDKVVALAATRDEFGATDPALLQAAKDAAAQAAAQAQADALTTTRTSGSTTSTAPNTTWAPPATSYSGAAVVAYAEQFVGVVPYGLGASPETSFGCDGLTQYVFDQFGIHLPRGVDHQAALGTQISRSDAQAGDLVVWSGEHIGIYDGHGGVVHSPDWGRYVEHASSLWGSPVFVRI